MSKEEEEDPFLAEMERELIGPTKHDELNGKRLYHYTDAGGFVGIIKSKQLWATHVRHLNDRSELLEGERIVEDVARSLASELTNRRQKDFLLRLFVPLHAIASLSKIAQVFVASLSECGDELSQWRGYGGGAAGYSVGFSAFRLPSPDDDPPAPDRALLLAKCLYNEDDYRTRVRHALVDVAKGCERVLDNHARSSDTAIRIEQSATSIALRRVAALVPRYKQYAFHEEVEWRLIAITVPGQEKQIQFRSARGRLVPYVGLELCEDASHIDLADVIVGPTVDAEDGELGARLLLKCEGYNPEMVRRSRIPFRG